MKANCNPLASITGLLFSLVTLQVHGQSIDAGTTKDANVTSNSSKGIHSIEAIPHELKAYKISANVAPAVWETVDRFLPIEITEKHKRLPKVIEFAARHRDMKKPEIYSSGIETRVLEKPERGYLFMKTLNIGEKFKIKFDQLNFLGIFSIVSQFESAFQEGNNKNITVSRISNIKFSDSFHDTVKPNARWSLDIVTDMEISSEGKFFSRESKQQSKSKYECVNGESASASTVNPKFSGNLVPVTCKLTVNGNESTLSMVYLEEYAYFVPKSMKSAKLESEINIQSLRDEL